MTREPHTGSKSLSTSLKSRTPSLVDQNCEHDLMGGYVEGVGLGQVGRQGGTEKEMGKVMGLVTFYKTSSDLVVLP